MERRPLRRISRTLGSYKSYGIHLFWSVSRHSLSINRTIIGKIERGSHSHPSPPPSYYVLPIHTKLRAFLLNVVIAALASCVFLQYAEADQTIRENLFRESLLPLLRTYCFDCHDSSSEISLQDDQSAEAIMKNRVVWTRALAQVRLGTMPPEDGEVMDARTRSLMVKLLDELANAVDCVRNPNAGKVVMRRLNRNEYRNTIFDLLGVDYKPAAGFPGDDVGYGFDNIGDVLSLPPILLERYLDAAETISGKVIYTPPPPHIYEIEKSPGSLQGADRWGKGSPLTLASNSHVALEFEAPFRGEYTITVTASGDQGGDEPCKMAIVSGNQKQPVDVPEEEATEHSVTMRLNRGKRKIEFHFTNDYYVANKVDRNLTLHHVHVIGTETKTTYVAKSDLPASHQRIITVKPGGKISDAQATASVLAPVASRAFRRPATRSEVQRLVALAAQVRKDGGTFEESIQVAIQAILVSPHFLFKVEQTRAIEPSGRRPLISQYELATRISYFLWSSMPDDELLRMARLGELRDSEKLLRKVGAMIMDRRSNQFIENFAGQWLQLRNLKSSDPDKRRFPSFNEGIRELMRRETLTFFAAVMRQNLPITMLLDANFTYLNEDLAKFYGIKNVFGDHFRKVSLAHTPRGGLLTQASVLTVTSNPTRTSPVKRGKWILENLLNTPPPPAPADVPELSKGKLSGTLRQRMEQHRDNPACAACHNMMDPLGFALENFDAVGRWRTVEGRDQIDASGKLPDGTAFSGVTDLRKILVEQRGDQFVRCAAEKLLVYATGRGTEYYDKCALDKIFADTKRHGYKFAYLIAAIIDSEPFQRQGSRE